MRSFGGRIPKGRIYHLQRGRSLKSLSVTLPAPAETSVQTEAFFSGRKGLSSERACASVGE